MAKPNIGDLIPVGAIGTAKAPQVLTGYTFSGDAGVGLAGSMPSRGTLNRTLSTQGQSVSIPSGYYTGGSISANFSNLIGANIKSGVNIGGVVGYFTGNRLMSKRNVELKGDGTVTVLSGAKGQEVWVVGIGNAGRGARLAKGVGENTSNNIFDGSSSARVFGTFNSDGSVVLRCSNLSSREDWYVNIIYEG